MSNILREALDGVQLFGDVTEIGVEVAAHQPVDLTHLANDLLTFAGRDFKLKTPERVTPERFAKFTADLDAVVNDFETFFEPVTQ